MAKFKFRIKVLIGIVMAVLALGFAKINPLACVSWGLALMFFCLWQYTKTKIPTAPAKPKRITRYR